ncbi:MAG TPA: D-aminoacyl-tRNA deacylase [Syntrophales bacterium]|nr:D-aminoacyl-tRNA deacylase [Syntrophales bacterium]HOX95141.1 D-aminoacyl-tRNA deacylase [Syntrophales bacterium]HPI55929.1 D-aminoacyl-tRNA deacylase [Syntrophales bacterium]HPN23580.1 D-aminoacyl-tRNA deacylase [Syntrophales bacterium]HQM27895.1 D-aminoacyl-tRNA deacylase [Syntrophales bacterium]
MRALIQRVDGASITVDGKEISRIGRGVLVLLGVGRSDSKEDAEYLLDKIINLRIFEDADGKMNLSLLETGGEMLVVSQFTLWADCRKGRRPSFTGAAEPQTAKNLYRHFVEAARGRLDRVREGEFQAMMKVGLVNDGPVTILLDSETLRGGTQRPG